MADDGSEPLKVILLGNSGVGKSNLIARFLSNEFSEEFNSTIGVEFVTKKLEVDGVPVKLQIWDTAGQERYASMMKTYYRKARGALLVYDVTSQKSFQGLEEWRKFQTQNADPRCVALVVGNKMDMPNVEVSQLQAEAYAHEREMGFVTTSAKTGEHVKDAFLNLAQAMLAAQRHDSGVSGAPGRGSKADKISFNKQPSNRAPGGQSSDCC